MNIVKNLNSLIGFSLVTVHSNKKNKDYYAIAINLGDTPIILKFLTSIQANAIIEMKGD